MKKKSLIISVLCLVFLMLFSGCTREKIESTITIDGESVTYSAKSEDTVAEILDDNGITLDEGDEVVPGLESAIDAENNKIEIYRVKTVTIKADGKETTVKLTRGTVADALEKAEIELGKNDKPNYEKDDAIADGMEITIARGKVIYVTVAGEKKEYITTKTTVEKALKELKIGYDEDDIVEPSKDSKIKKGTEITVKKVEVKTETEEKTIYFSEEKQYSSSMEKGTSKVTRNGTNGKKKVTYENTYVDGKLTDSKVVSEEVITKAVNKIVVYGTKAPATTAAPTTTKAPTTAGKYVVSKERVEDCDGSGHGYYIITYSDGSVVYEDF